MRRTLWMLGVTAAVVVLLIVSFGVHRFIGADGEPVGPEANAAASASAQALDAERAALLERVAAKRAELDRMIGRTIPIPGGKFRMGDDEGNLNERPAHEVEVGAFEIDDVEVTVAAYQLCVSAGKCAAPGTGPACNWGHPDRRGHPVNCVDWKQALAFCQWAAKRLPTEKEWAFAARGPSSSRFPWGNQDPSQRPCWRRKAGDAGSLPGTCPVFEQAGDESPFGVKGLAGNVREWTGTAMCPYSRPDCESGSVVMRGGAWSDSDPLGVRAALRNSKPQDYRSGAVGFRCARDALAAK